VNRNVVFVGLVCVMLAGCASHLPVAPSSGLPSRTTGSSAATSQGNKSPYRVLGKTYEVMPSSYGYLEIGVASWYGKKFQGRLTADGEIFNMYDLTAAHRSLPLPTMVRITNLDNGRKVVVRVNDRGPFHDERLIDVSWETAMRLGFADKGTAPVVVQALDELNYPDMVKTPEDHESFYLQVGAFSRLEGARSRLRSIQRVVASTEFSEVNVRILESELDKKTILHKVWLGPMKSEAERDKLAQLVEASNLGVPLRVQVE
jgi:rare lipoprotein A